MTRNKGLKQETIEYFQQNADRVVTLDELERELDGRARGSISSTTSKLCTEDEFPLERLGDGLYRWNSNGVKEKGKLEEGDLLEIILVSQGGKLLLKDGIGGVWVARQADLEEV